jgi:hypothetical protein
LNKRDIFNKMSQPRRLSTGFTGKKGMAGYGNYYDDQRDYLEKDDAQVGGDLRG